MRTAFVAGSDAEARGVADALRGETRAVPRPASRALERAAGGELEDRALVGTVTGVAEQIVRYRERLGMDLLVVRTEVPGASPAACERSLERLVGEVLPLAT